MAMEIVKNVCGTQPTPITSQNARKDTHLTVPKKIIQAAAQKTFENY